MPREPLGVGNMRNHMAHVENPGGFTAHTATVSYPLKTTLGREVATSKK